MVNSDFLFGPDHFANSIQHINIHSNNHVCSLFCSPPKKIKNIISILCYFDSEVG